MGRIGTFRKVTDHTLAEARGGGDILAEWRSDDGVTVRVTAVEYPHTEYTWDEAIRVAEYWVAVEGSADTDGSGPEAPFDGVHSTVSGAKDSARDVMKDISGDE